MKAAANIAYWQQLTLDAYQSKNTVPCQLRWVRWVNAAQAADEGMTHISINITCNAMILTLHYL